MKKLMILGAGIYQAPLITAAKSMGLYTIVVSPPGCYPGIPLADKHVKLDTTDIDGILSVARDEDIDGVLTTGTDVAVPAIGKIVEQLGLPGTSFHAARQCSDKTLMKQCLVKNNVPTADFTEVPVKSFALAESAAQLYGYPLMVKASDSSGSRGIIKVEYESDLSQAYQEASKYSRNGKIIIEQFLSGFEVGAQAVVIGGDVVKTFVHNDTVSAPPTNTPIGHSMPSLLSQDIETKIERIIIDAVSAMEIRDTIANIDLMIVNNEPFIIELGARMGATCLPENISTYWGQDIYQFLINLCLGNTAFDPQCHEQANASLLLTSDKNGILKSVHIPVELQDDEDIVRIQIDVRPGDKINAFRVGPDRLGDIIVKGKTAILAEQKAVKLSQQIEFEIDDANV